MKTYNDMMTWFASADLSQKAQYAAACEFVDIDSFVDYAAFELYIANEDWPGKNWGLWRTRTADTGNPYADGKWRWCIYDTEMGTYHYGNASTAYNFNSLQSILNSSNSTSKNVGLLLKKLMANDEFRQKLSAALTTYAQVNFEREAALAAIDSYIAVYSQTEMNRFFNRFPTWANYSNATVPCLSRLKTFINGRPGYIPAMISASL